MIQILLASLLLLAAVIPKQVDAFCKNPVVVPSRPQTTTRLYINNFFGNNKSNNDSDTKKKTAPNPKKEPQKVDPTKPQPFIFLWGKPEYNWSTGEYMTKGNPRRKNWLE